MTNPLLSMPSDPSTAHGGVPSPATRRAAETSYPAAPAAAPPQRVVKAKPAGIRCSEGALRIATRICTTYPDHHRVILFSGLTNKNQAGLTAYQTAIALAMMDEGRVLLVDAEPSRPFLGDLIRLPGKQGSRGKLGPAGFAQVLSGEAAIDDVLLTGAVENLDLVTAGAAIEPSWFLTERCNLLLKDFRQRYAFTIIATAPVTRSPECMRLAVHSDAVAAVVAAGKHSQKDLRQLTADLSSLSVPLLGVIFSG